MLSNILSEIEKCADDNKENEYSLQEQLKSTDYYEKNLMYFAVDSGKDDIVNEILSRIERDEDIMEMLNHRETNDGCDVFYVCKSPDVVMQLNHVL